MADANGVMADLFGRDQWDKDFDKFSKDTQEAIERGYAEHSCGSGHANCDQNDVVIGSGGYTGSTGDGI